MQIKPLYGEEAHAIRKRCGLTQDEFGTLVGRSRVQIGRYEKVGQVVPTLVALAYRGLEALRHEQEATHTA